MEHSDINIHHEENHRTKSMIRITMACNERCPFCNVPMEDYDSSTLTPSELENQREIDRAVQNGEKTLVFSGGEPTLLKNRLLSLLRYSKEQGIQFMELQSNAIKIDISYAQKLKEAGVTSAFISFLSHIPEKHDALTGLENSFEPCVRGILALLEVGIPVTLNPVLTSLTQDELVNYIEYVHQKFPQIIYISLSAMQPHGRGKEDKNIHLLPNYKNLKTIVKKAQQVAQKCGIELLNPYCGLPVCIGWTEAIDKCVESEEAKQGGWMERVGIENRQDKSQGRPCVMCLYRNHCGGAWHAYWEKRGGEGIVAPKKIRLPWKRDRDKEDVVYDIRDYESIDSCIEDIRTDRGLVRWLLLEHLQKSEVARVVSSACTDVAWIFTIKNLSKHDRTILKKIRVLRSLLLQQGLRGKQRTHICIPKNDPIEDKNLFLEMMGALGLHQNIHVYDGME